MMQNEINKPVDQDNIVTDIDKKPSLMSRSIRYIIKFVKNHKKATTTFVVITIAVIILFNLIPVITINNVKLVNVNSSVNIKLKETVRLKDGSVSVTVQNFTNDTCPTGKTCFGSGRSIQAVQYELTIDGKKYATGSAIEAPGTKYFIKTLSSDYSTFAEIEIIKR